MIIILAIQILAFGFACYVAGRNSADPVESTDEDFDAEQW